MEVRPTNTDVQTFLLRLCVAARTCLPSFCVTRIDMTHMQAHTITGGIYEVWSWDVHKCHVCIPIFIKFGPNINKLVLGGGHSDRMNLLSFLFRITVECTVHQEPSYMLFLVKSWTLCYYACSTERTMEHHCWLSGVAYRWQCVRYYDNDGSVFKNIIS
jgi:hypothetical protein